MPYISEEARWTVDNGINELLKQIDRHGERAKPGILNYIFTRLLKATTDRSYFGFALACGVLITCLLEFYRRFVGPYEDQKIKENGDVE